MVIDAPKLAHGWVRSTEYVMIIHGNEIIEPEELAQLGTLFDKTWAAVGCSANNDRYAEERTHLACILLRLHGLRQLDPDQVMQPAVRLFRQQSPALMSARISLSDIVSTVSPGLANHSSSVASPSSTP